MKHHLIALVALLAAVAAGLALTFLPAAPLPRTIEVAPPVTSKLVCAPIGEAGVLFVDGADTITDLGGDDDRVSGPTLVGDRTTAAVISGGHSLMGGTNVAADGGRTFAACDAPRSQGTVLVPSPAATDLVLVNPDTSEAIVDLSLSGADGEIVALGARGIAVGPQSSRTIALSILAEGEGAVGVDYRASRGRVGVVARTESVDVLEATTPSTPGREHWLAGIPAGATVATVLVANPGNERATVEVTAHGTSSAYQPEGGSAVTVPAHATIAVDLAASLAGESSGLHITSDVDVAVTLSTGTGGDLASSAPVDTAEELGAFGPAGGSLQLSNPGGTAATAQVVVDVIEGEETTSEVTVAAGTTQSMALPATAPQGQSVAVTSDAPLFGAIVHTEAGAGIVPLTSTQAVVLEPVDAEIVPTFH